MNENNLYIDIETVPTDDPEIIKDIKAGIKAPGNYKKQESIEKWMDENGEAAAREVIHKTGLSGTFGQVLSVGWAFGEMPVQTLIRGIGESEGLLLEEFWNNLLTDLDGREHRSLIWTGHNIIKFDVRFLYQRSIVTGSRPSITLPVDLPPSSPQFFDTMIKWAGWGGTVSLEALCKALSIPGKDGMTGADVWQYALDGRLDEIADYNKEDVEKVRSIHKTMTFNL